MYFTKLKDGHTLPMALMRQCPTCKQQSVYVNKIGDFAYRCVNPYCRIRNYLEVVPCMLRHRDFTVASMTVSLDNELWVDSSGDLDLDHPEMEKKIDYTEGPYKDCTGVLCWTEDGVSEGAHWLSCNVCKAAYRSYIFCYFSLAGESEEHSYFKLIRNSNQPWGIKPNSLVINSRDAVDVPRQWALAIDKVVYMGHEVVLRRNLV